MTISAIARQVCDTHSAVLLRHRAGGKGEPKQYDCKPLFTGNKRGWTLLDALTARAVLTVYHALSEANRTTFDTVPLTRLIPFCWKHVR